MKQLNVLCICSGYLLSGKEFVSLNVFKGFIRHNQNFKVLYSGWNDGKFRKKISEMGIDAEPIKLGWYYITKILWSLDSLRHYPAAVKKYGKARKKVRANITYVDSFRPVILLYPFIREKIVFHVNDPHAFSKINKVLLRFADKKISAYIAASGFIKNDLIECGIDQKKIYVIHNGIEIFEDNQKKYMPENKLRIGIVGQILERKGHEDIINACQLLKGRTPFEILIFGAGPDSQISYLKKMVEDHGLSENTKWMGFQSEKKAIYDLIDVLVAPTRNEEPFALVALEAMSFRIPVIASRSGGFPESVRDNHTGFIVAKRSPDEIAEKLIWFYNNPDQLKVFGNNGRESAVNSFSIEKMQNSVQGLLNNLINSGA
ncbi:MAG: glycosyltransferase family 4 protein [Bacteroidota bacterium]